MKRNFAYIHDGERVVIQSAHMDVDNIAAEIGYLTHNIYSTLMRQAPPTAQHFRRAILVAIAVPGTPTWEAGKANDGRIEIVVAKPKEGRT